MIVFFVVFGIVCKFCVFQVYIFFEIVRIWYGKIGYIVWIVFCFINNIIVIVNMLFGVFVVINVL